MNNLVLVVFTVVSMAVIINSAPVDNQDSGNTLSEKLQTAKQFLISHLQKNAEDEGDKRAIQDDVYGFPLALGKRGKQDNFYGWSMFRRDDEKE
ncbi:uncharacterized protein LOC144347609 [Saccoglossus kowalevskii]